MELTIKYFGQIAEVTQCQEEQVHFEHGNLEALVALLYAKYPELSTKQFQVAQNQELSALSHSVTGSEIALLPPFSGG